jgi:hypothetical protein
MHFVLSSERKKGNCRGRRFDRWNFLGFECDLDISSQPLIKFRPPFFPQESPTGQKNLDRKGDVKRVRCIGGIHWRESKEKANVVSTQGPNQRQNRNDGN